MAYLSEDELAQVGFKYYGKNVKISADARIYQPEKIEIGDFSRIDDFCILSGKIKIGSYVHITPMCLLAGGIPGVFVSDFCTLAYGVKIFAQTDDYSGESLTNSLIPKQYKKEKYAAVNIEKHVIIGTNAVIFPGVCVAQGCSIGAMALVIRNTQPWGIYIGQPAYRKKDRQRGLLLKEKAFLNQN